FCRQDERLGPNRRNLRSWGLPDERGAWKKWMDRLPLSVAWREKTMLCSPELEILEPRVVQSTFHLHQGDSLQHAIALASPGDTILLDAGATFRGPITLLPKANPDQQWITIQSNNFGLAPGVRVGPGDSASMAKIVASGYYNPAVRTVGPAAFYRLQGLEIL